MIRRGWDALAAWRDERMGERGDLWHRAIIDPVLLDIVGRVHGLAILDLGCGNGYLTRRWAREGAARSVGVDASQATIALARRRERNRPTGAEFFVRESSRLTGLARASFDLVVSNMALMDIRSAAGTLREVARVLRTEGRFVFSLCHPCFDLDERSAWVVERVRERNGHWHNLVWRKMRAYREERSVQVPWWISERETGFTTSYHRTLTSYSRLLRDAGFAITRLEEPSPLPEAIRSSPQGPFLREVPLHLVVEARSWAGTGPPSSGGAGNGARRRSAVDSRSRRRSPTPGGPHAKAVAARRSRRAGSDRTRLAAS